MIPIPLLPLPEDKAPLALDSFSRILAYCNGRTPKLALRNLLNLGALFMTSTEIRFLRSDSLIGSSSAIDVNIHSQASRTRTFAARSTASSSSSAVAPRSRTS